MTFRWLVAVLLALVVICGSAEAQGAGGPLPDPAGNVVVILTDDMALEDLSLASLMDRGVNANAITTSALDTLAAQGAIMPAFSATPQCSATRAGLLTGKYVYDHWSEMVSGLFSTAEHELAWAIEELAPGTITAHIGKGGWGGVGGVCSNDSFAACATDAQCGAGTCETRDAGTCQGDGTTACYFDSTCSGVGGPCNLPSNYTDRGVLHGFRYSWSDDAGQNPTIGGLYNYDGRLVTRTGLSPVTTSVSDATYTDVHQDETTASQFVSLWNTHSGQRKAFFVSFHAPHDVNGGFYDPADGDLGSTVSTPEAREELIQWLHDGPVTTVLTAIGDTTTDTCVIYLGDNGARAGFVTQAYQAKFQNHTGGVETGIVFSRACLRDNTNALGIHEGYAFDLPDLYDFILAHFDAQSSDPYPDLGTDDPRYAGQAWSDESDDLAGYLWDTCDRPDCWSIAGMENGAVYGGKIEEEMATDGIYRLVRIEGVDTLVLNDDLAGIELCSGPCPAGLTGPALAAWTVLDQRLSYLSSQITGSDEFSSAGTPYWAPFPTAVPSVASLNLAESIVHPTKTLVCDIVWGDGSLDDEFRAAGFYPGANNSVLKNFLVPGHFTATVDCIDEGNPSGAFNYSIPYYVPEPGPASAWSAGMVGLWALNRIRRSRACRRDTRLEIPAS